jgi:threonylcarbamoyladenosine tRNA methylthiotransferase MtaB
MAWPPRVALSNLGCRVNRVELDMMALAFQEAGCELTDMREADAVVINTCAVTGEAEAKTRKSVRHAAHLPQRPLVMATGCVASLFAGELLELAENVVVEADKRKVPERVLAQLGWDAPYESMSARQVPAHATPTGRTRPGIKIQDGCDNHCTFCIVWKARGRSRSVGAEGVLAEVRAALARGAREVVLTGINLGNYRSETDGHPIALPGLIELILEKTDVGRIRLGSIEPPDVTPELVDVMARSHGRVAPFLHVCLQSGCDKTLREMGRVYDTAQYAKVVADARAALPELSLGCDLIVGFPGESEQDFAQSLAFCEQMAFSRMHVFRYSRRPGTPAAARTDQVPSETSAARSEQMLRLASRMRAEQARARVGSDELVVVQRKGMGVSGGLFDVLVDDDLAIDELVRVRIRAAQADGTLDARTSTII